MTRALVTLAALVALVGCGGSDDDEPRSDGARSETTRVEVIESSGAEGGFDASAIYESEAPGVVTVLSLFDAGLFQEDQSEGVGTGFVLNGEGEIATNAHVVTTGEGTAARRAQDVYVSFADGNQVEAEVKGFDLHADIALLKIDPEGLRLRPLPLGASSTVEVGEPVAAIGSPFNEPQSLSIGVISAVDRTIAGLTQFGISGAFQTDAAINPGNSGGPLVDGEGRVIGVNQQIKSRSGGGEGVGFALPIDAVKRSIEMLRADGEARYAYLGVESAELYPQLVERFDIDVDEGAWVQRVNPGGPAEEAGIRGGDAEEVAFQVNAYNPGGDVIVSVEGEPVKDPNALATRITEFEPGAQITVGLRRDGEEREVDVRLGERPVGTIGG
jgi:S1-C subfamily serine protease